MGHNALDGFPICFNSIGFMGGSEGEVAGER